MVAHRRFRSTVKIKTLIFLINSIVPVSLGGLIYVIWRPKSLIMFHWFSALRLNIIVDVIRAISNQRHNLPSDWIIYSLPSGLWIYSFTFCLTYLWSDSKSKFRLIWIMIGPILGIGSEIMQRLKLIPGTYDVMDIVVYTIFSIMAIIAALSLAKIEVKEEREE